MQRTADDALDVAKVAYFRSSYGALGDEELAELAGRRDSLADEAIQALDDVLSTRGISVVEVAAAATPVAETPVEQQVSLAKELWTGASARVGQFLCLAAFGSLASFLAGHIPSWGGTPGQAGARAMLGGVVVLAAAYLGYRLGRYCTREICANAEKSIARRRSELRWFAAGVAVAYFLLFVLFSSAFRK